jgi:hypothetical protein
MKRLASALSLALVFSVVSCGDDEKSTVDAGIDAGTAADGGGATACTGTFAGINSTTLAGAIMASSGQKACLNDVSTVCTGNIAAIAGTCGVSCIGKGKDCITMCIKGQVAALSDGCNSCYADTVLCAQTNCLAQCVNDPAAKVCNDCQWEKGCRTAFNTCSGLPVGAPPDGGAAGDGGGSTGDGGAADAPGSDGGAADAPASDTGATDTAAAADMAAATDTTTD